MIESRITEILSMCGRENPIYEQISNYSVVLYALGYMEASDLMSVDDVDMWTASYILKSDFDPVDKSDIPRNYTILSSPQKYLLVIGDPLFPIHFAAIVDADSEKPFFSNPGHSGCGFDDLEGLMRELPVEIDREAPDCHYFRTR